MRPLRPFQTVRAAIVLGSLLLCLLPLLLLAVAYAYERVITRSHERELLALAREASTAAALPALGRRGGAAVLLLDRQGQVVASSGTWDQAVEASLVGGLAERVLAGVDHAPAPERLDEVERALGSAAARDEVRRALAGEAAYAIRRSPGGQMVLFQLAAPHPGGAVYLIQASRRGFRQLLLLRHELLKLVLYESVFALSFGLFLARRVARPLERLAAAARRYPSTPLADAALLSRQDEIGELSRAISALAADLEERRRAAADLGADVAHEFKNPLATIAASAELLAGVAHRASCTPAIAGGAAAPERVGMAAGHILASVERLRRSLDSLLSLLRLEAGLSREPREAVPYAELVEELLAEYRRDPRWQAVALRAEVAADAGEIRVVSHRWEELLRNLLDNALVQPADRPEVIVRVRRTAAAVITEVQDAGPGIAPGNLDQIFRRFFTQRPPGAAPGTGLGLSIVKAIAEAHGGVVEVRSTTSGEGAGATFVVTLPA